jgi:hypothetical protein
MDGLLPWNVAICESCGRHIAGNCASCDRDRQEGEEFACKHGLPVFIGMDDHPDSNKNNPGNERDHIHDRVDQVIDDLINTRISGPKVEALSRAVERAKSHGGVFRAIGGIGR